MRSGPRAVFVAIVVAGFVGLLATAATDERDLAFTLGVRPTQVAAVVPSQESACQAPIYVSTETDSARLQVGTFGRPGAPLRISARNAQDGALVSAGNVHGGYGDGSAVRAPARLPEGTRVSVCVQNRGTRRVALYGGPDQAARTSALRLAGRPTGTDMTLVLERKEPRSIASMLPEMVDRAVLFKGGWLSSGLLWSIAVLVMVGVPALLAVALSRADETTKR
jgi:hypothetical protein